MRQELSTSKFGTVYGVGSSLKDCENTEFTDYVSENYKRLVEYAEHLNIDTTKAVDLINDVWLSYKLNEESGKCFDMSMGHRVIQSIEESVHGRIKRTARNPKYYRATNNTTEVLAHFTDDTEDDEIQNAYTAMASCEDVRHDVVEDECDLQDSMAYFISCTNKCRVTGLTILEKIEVLVNNAGEFDPELLAEVWNCDNSMKECFKNAFKVWYSNASLYFSTLAKVKEELAWNMD